MSRSYTWKTVTRRCPCCGKEWPEYLVKDISGTVLGCENCLTIMKDGVIQL